ncbi:MAG: hypothetical protein IKI69_08230 [Oscillospiraceae bacterium]|nr:hypothetical protein [Oscillospiraceae bacterium]
MIENYISTTYANQMVQGLAPSAYADAPVAPQLSSSVLTEQILSEQ